MPLDLNKSYDDINNKIESFNTFKKSKSDVKNRLQQKTNFDVSSLSSAAKGEAKNQLDNLINTFTNTNSSGSATITYLLGKFVRSVKLLRPQIKEIIVKAISDEIYSRENASYIIQSAIEYVKGLIGSNLYGVILKKTEKSKEWIDKYIDDTEQKITELN